MTVIIRDCDCDDNCDYDGDCDWHSVEIWRTQRSVTVRLAMTRFVLRSADYDYDDDRRRVS